MGKRYYRVIVVQTRRRGAVMRGYNVFNGYIWGVRGVRVEVGVRVRVRVRTLSQS